MPSFLGTKFGYKDQSLPDRSPDIWTRAQCEHDARYAKSANQTTPSCLMMPNTDHTTLFGFNALGEWTSKQNLYFNFIVKHAFVMPPVRRNNANEPTIAQLRERCRERGLSDRGRRNTLVARLQQNPVPPYEPAPDQSVETEEIATINDASANDTGVESMNSK